MDTDLTQLANQTSKIFNYIRGMHATHLIETGVKLGFFERIAEAGESGVTSHILSKTCSSDPRYTENWCHMAASLELLEAAGDGDKGTRNPQTRYYLAPYMDDLLANRNGTFYIGGAARSHIQISRDYQKIVKLFRTGSTFPFQKHSKRFLTNVALSNKALSKRFIEMILPKFPELKRKLELDGGRLLDVGCGGGYAIVGLAKTFPKCTCLGVDIEPQSIKLARKLIAANNLQNRVKAMVRKEIDYGAPNSYDLVTLFLVLHEIEPKIKQDVIDTVARVLAPGGMLMIYDEAYPETFSELKSTPQYFSVMAQWFEGFWGNIINTRSEIRQLIGNSGLTIQNETNFSRYYIVTATKT